MRWWEPYAVPSHPPPMPDFVGVDEGSTGGEQRVEIVALGLSEADQCLLSAIRAISEAGHMVYFPEHPGKVTL